MEVCKQQRLNQIRLSIGDIHILDSSQNKTIITKDQEKANVFSEYLSSAFTIEPLHNIPELKYNMPENSLPVIQFTTENILKEFGKLKTNKSCGPDNLHPRVIKELPSVICDA